MTTSPNLLRNRRIPGDYLAPLTETINDLPASMDQMGYLRPVGWLIRITPVADAAEGRVFGIHKVAGKGFAMKRTVLLVAIVGSLTFAFSGFHANQRMAAREVEKTRQKTKVGNVKDAKADYSRHLADDNQDNYAKAIADYTEAIRLDPRDAKAYYSRGLAYDNKGDYDKAIADYTEAIRLDPKDAKAYFNRGGIYDDMRNYDKAIADFTEVIRLDPKSAKAYSSGRADTYEHKGDHDKAIRDSIEAIRLDPNCASAHNSLGIAYDGYAREMSRADAEVAESLFDRASKNFDAPPRKLDAVQQQVPFDGSVENFKAATKKLDRAHKVQLLFDYSAAAFKAAIDIQPDYDFGNNNLGVYYARRGGPGDSKLAEKYFRGALTSNPRYADAYNNLAIMLARQGADLAGKGDIPGAMLKFDESIFVHKKGLEVRNVRASDHNNLCRVYMQKYDLDTKQGNLSSATALSTTPSRRTKSLCNAIRTSWTPG